MIVAGTFGPITLPPVARALALCVALAIPFVGLTAAVAVVRRRVLATIVLVVGLPAALAHIAPIGQLALSLATALACISVGVALARLIPRAWLLPAVAAMAAVDIAFLASGIGAHQDVLLAAASKGLPGFALTGVQLGGVYIGYPDLFLAGLLGAAVAADGRQPWAAGMVFVLTLALETLLVPGETLPATLPLALTLLLTTMLPPARSRSRAPADAPERDRTKHRKALATSEPATVAPD